MNKKKLEDIRFLPRRVKDNSCRNCGLEFEDEVNYCPRCGQINNIRRITFLDFIRESLGDFFAYDNRMFNSLIPLFTKPGVLSKDYIAGKRAHHIHPIRLYFVASFLFFFISSIADWKSEKFGDQTTQNNSDIVQLDESINNKNILASIAKVNDSTKIDSSLIDSARINNLYLMKLMIIQQQDSIVLSRDSLFKLYSIEPTLTRKLIYSKVSSLKDFDYKDILNSYSEKFPLVAFFFLPFFVIFLNIFHFQKDILYFEHIIFAFHIQAVFFLLLTLVRIATIIYSSLGDTISPFIVIGFAIYLLIAMKNFYEYKSWFKSILMWTLINFFYMTLALFIFITSISFFFVIS